MFDRKYVYYIEETPDIDRMKQAAGILKGEHDFKSFCSVHTQALTTIREITEIKVERERPACVYITVKGKGFLYNMVRIMVGTLIKIAQGKFPPDCIGRIIEAKDRSKAGATAPSCGLYLNEVRY